jgi:31-O-methyltransferase
MDRSRQERIDTVASLVHHPDPAQLWFQLAEIAGEQIYLRHGVSVDPGDVILDVGANVGVAAVFFGVLCRAGCVHSFEPVGPVFDILSENVGELAACRVHPHGLAARCARLPFTYYPGACAMSGLYADPDRDRALVRTVLINRGLSDEEAEAQLADRYSPQTLTCPVRPLSWVLREHRIGRVNLLKIDVERAELDVLSGIEAGDWPKIEQIVIEVHDEDGRSQALVGDLQRRGFRVTCDVDRQMRGTSIRMLYATRR